MIKTYTDSIEIGEVLECPICSKSFRVNEDTKYIIGGGYVCDWSCFLKRDRELNAMKKKPLVDVVIPSVTSNQTTNNTIVKRGRGRPRKIIQEN